MKTIAFMALWFPLTCAVLISTVWYYYNQTRPPVNTQAASPPAPLAEQVNIPQNPGVVYANEGTIEPWYESVLGAFHVSVIAGDARPKIVANFLNTYSCPLEPSEYFAEQYVETADRYNLDFRLLPAISMQESTCCKRIPQGSNNCWGYGIYGDKVTRFSSYEEGMDTVAKTLSEKYVTNGLLEPDEIMLKYTPQSKGSWAAGVLHFMNEMK